MMTRALARARLEGNALLDVQEIFVADAWIPGGPMAGRAVFGPDGHDLPDGERSRRARRQERRRRAAARAAARQRHRQSLAGSRRRRHSGRQPVRRAQGRETGNFHVRATQRDGLRLASDYRRALDHGDRADGRRRDQYPAQRAQLRLAARVARQELQPEGNERQPLVPARHGYARHVLDARDQPVDAGVVHGRQAGSVAGASVRRRAERPDAGARGVRSAHAASRAARFAVHVARPTLAARGAGPGRLSLRADGEAHARRHSRIRPTRRAVWSIASSPRDRR